MSDIVYGLRDAEDGEIRAYDNKEERDYDRKNYYDTDNWQKVTITWEPEVEPLPTAVGTVIVGNYENTIGSGKLPAVLTRRANSWVAVYTGAGTGATAGDYDFVASNHFDNITDWELKYEPTEEDN